MRKNKIVLIGASTGGPGHLRKLLLSLSESMNYSIIISQHMNSNVVASFATQMQENCSLPVILAKDKLKIIQGNIYICAISMELIMQNNALYLVKSNNEDIYSPSVNTLFYSAKNLLSGTSLIAILLTGIGDDGARGMLELYNTGAYCIAESQESAVVYGMPKQAYILNKHLDVMHLHKIIEYLQHA
ncbi:chemotaxis protein CheB [Sulfurimonas sp. SAG-AH-194-I05]|nr:CheB methylesterase domain-containing protein [Sulfurimonas sp. SAG-AH-194-I05]MDF1876076.1 chemotaxis protein CheB [Sulfurimonas sp. SAG-AH-194-I05]